MLTETSTFNRIINMLARVLAGGLITLGLYLAPSSQAIAQNKSFIAKHSGKCLDVSYASQDDEYVIQYTCHFRGNQRWHLEYLEEYNGVSWHHIIAAHSGKCLQPYDNGYMIQSTCGNTLDQRWYVRYRETYQGRRYYDIINRNSGKCLEVSGRGTTNYILIIQNTCHSGRVLPINYNQIWYIY